jgi:hypothetical protein
MVAHGGHGGRISYYANSKERVREIVKMSKYNSLTAYKEEVCINNYMRMKESEYS